MDPTVVLDVAQANDAASNGDVPVVVTIGIAILTFIGGVGAAWLQGRGSIKAAKEAARAELTNATMEGFRRYQTDKRAAINEFRNAAQDLIREPNDPAARVAYSRNFGLLMGLAYRETREYLDQFEVKPADAGSADRWAEVDTAIRTKWDELTDRLEHDQGLTGPWR
jgi:hypothetical protein